LWFGFIEPFRKKDSKIDIVKVLREYKKSGQRLISSVFEELSIDLLKEYLNGDPKECYSYWDYFSEFDIYCKFNDKMVVGECKYTSRFITKRELIKLQKKLETSALQYDYIALFSKNGFSKELYKMRSSELLLFELKDFKEILLK
jgi:hypothetical protein